MRADDIKNNPIYIIKIAYLDMVDDVVYDLEITHESMRYIVENNKLNKQLKPHQLACLYKAIKMEKEGTINYNITPESYKSLFRDNNYHITNRSMLYSGKISISTNIGIIGDIVGYGKTLTALSLIAYNPLDNIHTNKIRTNSYNSTRGYNYFTSICENTNIPDSDTMIDATLIIVPRGPVYIQWEKTLKESTNLKYIAIDNLLYIKKFLPEYKNNNKNEIIEFFNQYDVVLIKNTTLDILLGNYGYYNDCSDAFITRWKRIMIDECHDLINKIITFNYLFMWLISGTYMNMSNKSASYNSIYQNIKDILKIENINYLLVKCTKEFVRDSFKIPPLIEKYYLCKLSKNLEIIKNFISPHILEKINANDIAGAIKDLGGKNETEDGIVELICKEINKDISNKVREREYVDSLTISADTKVLKLKNIDADLKTLNDKLLNLKNRITEINSKTCAICLDIVSNPILLECAHVFCAGCLIKWLMNIEKNSIKHCPECRNPIKSTEKLTAIVSHKNIEIKPNINNINVLGTGVLTKEETLLGIIKNKPNGKFIVFSKIDNGFWKVIETLMKNNIEYAELKGNTSHMMNVLNKFREGSISVILLNTQYAGSGIDISFATDIIIYHCMNVDKQQAVGRAQRVGRNDNLYVHNLCYEHEMSQNI